MSTELASRSERPWGCRSREVVAGTECVINASNRCTYCGRPMKRVRYRSLEALRAYHAWMAGKRDAGTDPIEWEAGGPDYWNRDPGQENT